jgi:hypothetical protein
VVRSIIHVTLSNRALIYGNPDLTDFAGNGGSRINNKVRSYLTKFAALIPDGDKMVDEEIAKLGKGGKPKSASANNISDKVAVKKRKVVVDDEEDKAEEAQEEGDELDEDADQ